MTKNNRYVAGFIKTIEGKVSMKWEIRKGVGNKSYSIPSKKYNKKIKLFNEQS